MSDLDTRQLTLPLLAVPTVLLPGTVFTFALSSDAARAAVQSAEAGDGRLVLHNEAAGDIGVVARVPSAGAMPNGEMAAIVQAEGRARIVARHPSERGSDHVQIQLLADSRPTPRVEAAARELRVVLEEIASCATVVGSPRSFARSANRGSWPMPSPRGARPTSTSGSPSSRRSMSVTVSTW